MSKLGSYEILEKLDSSPVKAVYRVLDPSDQHRYILKAVMDSYANPVEAYQLKNEYEMLKDLSLGCVVPVAGLDVIDGALVLRLEDFDAVSLDTYMKGKQLSLSTAIDIGEGILRALYDIQASRIIHKDINPSNILVDPNTLQIWISDFGNAERMSQGSGGHSPGGGSPPYISPEQTGRTRWRVDSRTDIYSAGTTLYHVFSGRLPFDAQDIAGYYHAHIAVRPIPLNEQNPDIPAIFSDIVMKMIEKNPDNRYASMKGVIHDFEKAGNEYRRSGVCPLFEVGREDVPQNCVVSEKILGKTALFSEIDSRISDLYFKSSYILISGARGSGKSLVMNRFYQQGLPKPYFQISARLSAQDADEPYSVIRRMADSVVEELIQLRPERIPDITTRMASIAGSNLDRVLMIFPSLRRIIDAPAEHVEAAEDGQWVQRFILDVAELIIRMYDRLVVLIDDMHYMDADSCELLLRILPERFTQRILLVGAFDPVKMAERKTLCLNAEMEKSGIIVLELQPFSREETVTLLRETFRKSLKRFSGLADLIWDKTRGNPYFTVMLIRQLYDLGMVHYVPDFGQWDYDETAIERLQVTDNVLGYLRDRMQGLSDEMKTVLGSAACINAVFTTSDLQKVLDFSMLQLLNLLNECVDIGLIRVRNRYEFGADPSHQLVFTFVHDEIQASLKSTIPFRKQIELSKRYVFRMFEESGYREETLSLLVRHVNKCIGLDVTLEERRIASQLNFRMAVNQKYLGAYGSALDYARRAVEWVRDASPEVGEDEYYEHGLLRAELEYLNGRFDEAERCFELLETWCGDTDRSVHVIKTRMVLYINQGRMQEALILAERALEILKVPFNPEPSTVTVGLELLKFKLLSGKLQPEMANFMNVSKDPKVLLTVDVLMTLISVSYLVSQNLFAYVILRILNLSRRHGVNVYSGYAFTIYGLVEGSLMNNPVRGLEYGELGIRLAQRFGNGEIIGKSHFTYGFFLNHWVHHPKENIPHLEKTIHTSYQAGDMVFFCYGVAGYILALIDSGHMLDDVLNEVERYLNKVREAHVEDVFNLFLLLRQFIYCLKGETDSPVSLNSVDFDEAAFIQRLKNSSMQSIYAVFRVFQMKLYYLFGQFDEAVDVAEALVPYTKTLMGLSVYPEYYQYYSLALIDSDRNSPGWEKKIRHNQLKLWNWRKFAPENFAHKHLSVAAAKKLRENRYIEAEQLLTEALKVAQRNGFIQDEALICSYLSRCYAGIDNGRVRSVYLRDAYRLYRKWGAHRKSEYLERSNPEISFAEPVDGVAGNSLLHSSSGDSRTAAAVDVISIYKAAGILSSEIQLNQLLYKLMGFILENAGAQRALLFLASPELRMRASADAGAEIVLYSGNDDPCEFPSLLIQQVARNQEMLLVDDFERDSIYRRDAYFERNAAKSILVIPIFGKGRLAGLLYLENRLMTGAFTMSRVDVLKILTSQFVVSYENAVLYESLKTSEEELMRHKENLESLVDQRTIELSEAHFEIRNLLDHAGQGFFSCSSDGVIRQQVSQECYRIFRRNIAGEKLAALICEYDPSNEVHLTERILDRAFRTATTFEGKVYLSLLPKEIQLGSMFVSMEYQIIDDGQERRLMVILTDITETRALEAAREEEKHNLKMVARVIKYHTSFQRSLEDFIQFYQNGYRELIRRSDSPKDAMQELFRMVHTYKGDMAQWGLRNTAHALHEIESVVQYHLDHAMPETLSETLEIAEDLEFEKSLSKDIRVLKESAGLDLLKKEDFIEISRERILALEAKVRNLDTEGALGDLLTEIRRLRLCKFKALFEPYNEYIQSLAFSLDKRVCDLSVQGEDVFIDPLPYNGFMKSINHIFRNMVDYGIEMPEERVKKGKDETGMIQCRIARNGDAFLQLTLWDDGAGLPIERLREVLINKSPDRASEICGWTDDQVAESIFSDGISTKEDISLISGRGMGMAAVREETEKLGGTARVRTEADKGVAYEIEIPILING